MQKNGKYINFAFLLVLAMLAFIKILFTLSAGKDQQTAVSVKIFSSKCWSMFNIGVQKYPQRIGFGKRKFEVGVGPGPRYYESLAAGLPSRLHKPENGSVEITPKSRLELTEGLLAYADCRVRHYTPDDVITCAEERRKRKNPLWIAFAGDSKIRGMFKGLLQMTKSLHWYTFNTTSQEKTSVSWETYFLHHTRKFQTVSVVGERETRVDFIWATKGLKTVGIYGRNQPERQLEEWAYRTERVPDVVIVGFGPWIITEEFVLPQESLRASVNLWNEWQTVAKVLNALSKRTTVLAVCQTRPRQAAIVGYITENLPLTVKERLFRLLYVTRQEAWASDWMDETMHLALRDTGVVIWDSMVPFSLKNIYDCQVLHKEGFDEHPLYLSPLQSCNDTVHGSGSVIQDGNTLVFNYLCNHYLEGDNDAYCC